MLVVPPVLPVLPVTLRCAYAVKKGYSIHSFIHSSTIAFFNFRFGARTSEGNRQNRQNFKNQCFAGFAGYLLMCVRRGAHLVSPRMDVLLNFFLVSLFFHDIRVYPDDLTWPSSLSTRGDDLGADPPVLLEHVDRALDLL